MHTYADICSTNYARNMKKYNFKYAKYAQIDGLGLGQR